MKITVIGGGSTYTPEIVLGLIERAAALPVSELCLMDTDMQRLETVGGFCQRMLHARGDPFRLGLTEDLSIAVGGASYVITQFRVGQMSARIADEYLGRRHNLIGQETTGIGGMAKALRTIPVVLQVAEKMEKLAPEGLLINFTNPSGLVMEALSRYAPRVRSIGLCNSAITTQMTILQALQEQALLPAPLEQIDHQDVCLDVLGLNHLTWYRGFKVQGRDYWSHILAQTHESGMWERDLIEVLGMIPNNYLQYFYYTEKRLADQRNWPPSRAEQVVDIEKALLAQYADPARSDPPADLMKRGGAYYSTLAAQVINAHYNDLDEVHVVNVRNAGAVAVWPSDWVLEMPCRINQQGAQPLPAQPLPEVCYGLLAQVKMYELLTVEAAVHGDRRRAAQALLAHPLGPGADQLQKVLVDLLETNRAYLPQFFA